MATITLTIPNSDVDRVVTALCAAGNVDPTPANAKDVVRDMIRRTVANVEYAAAVAAAAPREIDPATIPVA